jgi:hypothetical protein
MKKAYYIAPINITIVTMFMAKVTSTDVLHERQCYTIWTKKEEKASGEPWFSGLTLKTPWQAVETL